MKTTDAADILRAYINILGSYSIVVNGSCMNPLIKKGNKVIITYRPYHKLKKGDIIAVQETENICVHRILKINDRILFTKGDGACRPDISTSPSKYIGFVSRSALRRTIASLSLIQSKFFLAYEKDMNKALYGNLFRLLIRINRKLNTYSSFMT